MRRICIYCGSSRRVNSVYREAAQRTGEAVARRGLGLVYGGASIGLMGVVADAVLEGGGDVIGVMPRHYSGPIVHKGLTEMRLVDSMHERKAAMASLADAFLALPGAYGTLDEFCEILTWAQLRLHDKPCGLLNVEHYFDRFLAFLNHAVTENFLQPVHRALVIEETDPERMLDRLGAGNSSGF